MKSTSWAIRRSRGLAGHSLFVDKTAASACATAVLALVLTSCGGSGGERVSGGPTGSYVVSAGIHKIKHIVVIMQENRSFDSYFGTFPGADGVQMSNGKPTVCVPDPATGSCVAPYPDHADVNGGGPHNYTNATSDINGGKMNGFIGQAEGGRQGCTNPTDPACTNSATPDVMGYHTQSDIPNYWTYANDFVLQDHMFEPNASWSLPSHLFLVSEWAAYCTKEGNPSSCVNGTKANPPAKPPAAPAVYGGEAGPKKNKQGQSTPNHQPIYAWTDLTYLLHKNNVSWGYYVVSGTEPDCENPAAETCAPVAQNSNTPGIWNPLPWFDTVKADQDPRPDVRENQKILGNLESDFNFNQSPGAPLVLQVHPQTTLTGTPTAAPALPGAGNSSQLSRAIVCFDAQGVSLPPDATTKQVKAALDALSQSTRQAIVSACASDLPAKLRQKLQR